MKKFTNARIYRGRDDTSEILVENGKIKQIGKGLPATDNDIDLKGRLVVPPYVDAHLHLDYVYTGSGEGAANKTGTLFEGIARWHDVKKTQTLEDARERALKGIREEVSKGVQFIRTHIDVDDPKLTGLKAMLESREELADNVTIQIVAFPQEGMYAYKGGDEMVEEALKMGADCVGSIPHFEWAREIGEKSIHRTRVGHQIRQDDRRALRRNRRRDEPFCRTAERPGDERGDRHPHRRQPHVFLRLGRQRLCLPHDGVV